MTGFRVTYATLSADDDELHAAFDKGIAIARGWLDVNVDPVVSGVSRPATEATVVVSPNDHDIVIANVGEASPIDVDDAVTAPTVRSQDGRAGHGPNESRYSIWPLT